MTGDGAVNPSKLVNSIATVQTASIGLQSMCASSELFKGTASGLRNAQLQPGRSSPGYQLKSGEDVKGPL